MGEIEIKPIALLISFVIWLDIDINVIINLAKNKYKRKSERFREKAKDKGNYVIGRKIKSKYDKVIYEYRVNGKKYKKKVYYTNGGHPAEQYIYYKSGNPRISIAENETKNGFFYTMISLCIPFSVFIGIPVLSWLITSIINIF